MQKVLFPSDVTRWIILSLSPLQSGLRFDLNNVNNLKKKKSEEVVAYRSREASTLTLAADKRKKHAGGIHGMKHVFGDFFNRTIF